MTDDRWRRIEALFGEAIERPRDEREWFLLEACPEDETLRAEVESLLAHHDQPNPVLLGPALGDRLGLDPQDILGDERADPMLGRPLGPYTIEHRIAAGGMGTVYRAVRRDGLYDQTVAIKVVRRGIDSAELLRRFQLERQTLANLVHPNIARLIDAGLTDDHWPYLVMEYVDGRPIDRYCDEHRLDVKARLRLFQTVCRAVHFAHQNLIIHRDVKPGNVLVTAEGEPKLLDFGIAKVLARDAETVSAERTRTVNRVMTPEYASPEQARGGPVTTACDVYSLGVVLYDLLSGQSPYRLTSGVVRELEQAVIEQDPRKPSTAVRETMLAGAAAGGSATAPGGTRIRSAADAEALGRDRSTTAHRLQRSLRGDLDNIVLMALRKEPERRYPSAQELAEDIGRYLAGRPVIARADTFLYRSSKFVRRNRALVSAAIVVVLALCGGLTAFGWQARIAAHERDAARAAQQKADREATAAREAERRTAIEAEHARIEALSAREMSGFLTDSFMISAPNRSDEEMEIVKAQLARDVVRVHLQYAEQLHLKANLIDAFGRVYLNLSLFDEAEALIREALAIRTDVFGERSLEVALSLDSLGQLHHAQGRFEEAEADFRRALELHRALPEDVHTDVANAANNLAVALRRLGRFDEAETLHREALALRETQFGRSSPLVAESMNNLAGVYLARGEYEQAAGLLREALEIRESVLGDQHPLVAQSMNNLAVTLHAIGDLDGAERLYRESIRRFRHVPGTDLDAVAKTMTSLAQTLIERGELREAEANLEEALSIQVRLFGPDHLNVATVHERLARLSQEQDRLDSARAHWLEALRIREASLPADSPDVAATVGSYGAFLVKVGEYDEAEATLRRALAMYATSLPADHWYVAMAQVSLGACLMKVSRYDEAERLLLTGYRALLETRGDSDPRTAAARGHLRDLYEAWGFPDRAAEYAQGE